jgi:hypothetical protein
MLAFYEKRYNLFRSGVNLCSENACGKKTWQKFLEITFNGAEATNAST